MSMAGGESSASADSGNSTATVSKRPRDDGSESETQSMALPASDSTGSSTGLRNSLHGNIFQLKLLMFFLIRGIGKSYPFELATEMPGYGGKFDDLVFRYRQSIDLENGTKQEWYRYRFLQAKHKQEEVRDKITANQLLNDNKDDFSLPKYLRSYFRDIIEKSNQLKITDIEDCIICTNIGFEQNTKLKEEGIELVSIDESEDILHFSKVSNTKTPARFKLRATETLLQKMKQWSSRVHLLAKTLLDYALIHPNKLTLQKDIWKSFHVTLVNELILDNSTPNMTKFHTKFLEGTSLKENVERFRQIISNETFIHYYCQKLKVARGPVTRKKKKVDQSTRLETFWQLLKDESLPQYDKSMTIQQFEIFESYRKDLEKEAVIVPKIKNNGKLFTDQFIQSSSSLSDRALEFRKILSNKASRPAFGLVIFYSS